MIRAANSEDVRGLLALQEACWPPDMRDEEAEIARRVLQDLALVWVDGDAIVGAAFLEHRRGTGWHLYAVEVLPDHRRKGLASQLLAHARAFLGAVPITADAVTEEGRATLASAGFAPVGVLMQLC